MNTFTSRLTDGFQELVAKHNNLTREHEKLTQELVKLTMRDEVSRNVINHLKSQKETLEKEINEIKLEKMHLEGGMKGIVSELEVLQSEKLELDKLRTDSEKAFKNEKKKLCRIESLIKQCQENNRKCVVTENELAELKKKFESKCKENNSLKSDVNELRAKEDLFQQEIDNAESLRAELNEQFVMSLEVKNTIDSIKIAHKKVIDAMEEAHRLVISGMQETHRSVIQGMEETHRSVIAGMEETHRLVIAGREEAHRLEMLALSTDKENKRRVFLELQGKVRVLEAENRMLSEDSN
ncbi:hypothetical protein Tco_0774276 [Tanacetum coccineum]|uniref:Uncharacterized protein n=1 Tax=Tanacetum coccineum TaxID=301880 RepID=A0ABQ4ZNY2_9ASTR